MVLEAETFWQGWWFKMFLAGRLFNLVSTLDGHKEVGEGASAMVKSRRPEKLDNVFNISILLHILSQFQTRQS